MAKTFLVLSDYNHMVVHHKRFGETYLLSISSDKDKHYRFEDTGIEAFMKHINHLCEVIDFAVKLIKVERSNGYSEKFDYTKKYNSTPKSYSDIISLIVWSHGTTPSLLIDTRYGDIYFELTNFIEGDKADDVQMVESVGRMTQALTNLKSILKNIVSLYTADGY